MNKELKEIIDSDLVRYGDIAKKFPRPLYLRYQIIYRKAVFYKRNTLRGIWYRLRLTRLSELSGLQLPTDAKIGRGLFIGHNGRLLVNPKASIGENCNIATGVTIGKANRGERAGFPTVGNKVWIGTNAVLVGKITIGDDVLIAPNSFVNVDVPSHSIVVGNPAVIHPSENATYGYSNNLCEWSDPENYNL